MQPHEYDDLLRSLVQIAAHQDTINQDQREFNRQQLALTERLTLAIERLDTTQARIETLLARMIERSPNGTDA